MKLGLKTRCRGRHDGLILAYANGKARDQFIRDKTKFQSKRKKIFDDMENAILKSEQEMMKTTKRNMVVRA